MHAATQCVGGGGCHAEKKWWWSAGVSHIRFRVIALGTLVGLLPGIVAIGPFAYSVILSGRGVSFPDGGVRNGNGSRPSWFPCQLATQHDRFLVSLPRKLQKFIRLCCLSSLFGFPFPASVWHTKADWLRARRTDHEESARWLNIRKRESPDC